MRDDSIIDEKLRREVLKNEKQIATLRELQERIRAKRKTRTIRKR